MTTIQDVWDEVISCLGDSQQDLQSCALVSRSWTPRAQSHFFRRVVIPSHDFIDPETNQSVCGRLGQTLSASPHLIPFIRILDVPFIRDVLAQICAMGLTHLEVVAFQFPLSNPGPAMAVNSEPNPILDYAQQLITLPSVQKLELSAPHIPPGQHLSIMTRVFCNPSLRLERLRLSGSYYGIPEAAAPTRRPSIKFLHLDSSESLGEYFTHPHCPFDLTQLVDFVLVQKMSPAMARALELGRWTLKRLVCFYDALVNQHVELSRFPSLTHLVVVGPQVELAAIAHAISQSNLTPQARIQNIGLILTGSGWHEEDGGIEKLDTMLSEIPALTKVNITFQPRNVNDTERLRSSFPKLDASGVLKINAAP
ncbi:hypothetical protein B0H16DRAFT_1887779 [Mycena metata]|uniref:F-box domain-containing protein n=1 Tax=Mycena metata TaxID=1033252 RepID=A0AAD7IUH3_9AGAR|nr:hypothetical protein B0H16DRAFT_1887779 [Mycena metata]